MSTDQKPSNWPISNKYQMAVQHPEMAFQDQELKIGQVAVQSNGLPMLSSGKYACVFKVTSGLRSYAVRCFLTEVKDQHRRYDMLSSHLKQFRLHSLVGFFYIPQGILVEGNWYPILKMDWDSGKPLDAFIGQNIHKPNVIKNLAANWRGVQAGLRGAYMAHGDLQHGNIQVATTGEITLVDYDCMYIPGFKGEISPEGGHKNYQHPQRTDQYGEWLDNFSALVIYLSLLGLAADPSLWGRFYNEDNLILKEEDFRNPSQSPCFGQLKSSPDPVVRTLAKELEDCCRNDITQTPILEVLLQGIQQPSARPAVVTVPQIEPLEVDPQQLQTTLEGRVFCESCGKEIEGDTQWCENCGKAANVSAQENIDTGTNQKKSHTSRWVLAATSIFLILIALLIWIGASGHSQPVSTIINPTASTSAAILPANTWKTFLGGVNRDEGRSITVDSEGNTYITGSSTATWGTPVRAFTPVTSAYSGDAFVAKLDKEGNLLWNTFLGNGTEGFGIAVDARGNVYATGGGDGAFVAKFDPNGNLLWNNTLGDGYSAGSAISLDTGGNIYVTGDSGGTTWGTPVQALSTRGDAFVAKLNNNGQLEWNTFLGGTGFDSGSGIALDGNNNVYITGFSDATWGSPLRPSTSNGNLFVTKLNDNGTLQWNTFFPASSSGMSDWGSVFFGIALDRGGNIYVAGSSDATWGSPLKAYQGEGDAFVARLNQDGNLVWNTFLGCGSYDYGDAIVAANSGNIYVTGISGGTWGSPKQAMSNTSDAFIAKLDNSGALQGNTFLGSVSYNYGAGIAVDGSENVYVTGYSSDTWGSSVRGFNGSGDAFVAKLDSNLYMSSNLQTPTINATTPVIKTTISESATTTPLWLTQLSKNSILPGIGMAGIKLGDSESTVTGLLGYSEPVPVTSSPGEVLYYAIMYQYNGLFLGVYTDPNTHTVWSIRLSDDDFNKAGYIPFVGGVSIGSTESQLQSYFGPPVSTDQHYTGPATLADPTTTTYTYGKISFWVCSNNLVYLIDIP